MLEVFIPSLLSLSLSPSSLLPGTSEMRDINHVTVEWNMIFL
jgi:hypothetical protein